MCDQQTFSTTQRCLSSTCVLVITSHIMSAWCDMRRCRWLALSWDICFSTTAWRSLPPWATPSAGTSPNQQRSTTSTASTPTTTSTAMPSRSASPMLSAATRWTTSIAIPKSENQLAPIEPASSNNHIQKENCLACSSPFFYFDWLITRDFYLYLQCEKRISNW